MEEIEDLALVRIENLKLRTIIGINEWERKEKQDVTVNIKIRFDATRAGQSDSIEDTVNYKAITKKVIKAVEESKFYLVEKLARVILDISMEDPRVVWASVKLDKPFALRFADSVSIEVSDRRR